MTLVDGILSTPQEASMLIVGGMAAVLYYGCGMYSGRRCEPGKLLIFVGSAAGMVAGVYVFFEALKATFSKSALTFSYQNAVWAGIGGACVALFTFDLLVTELKTIIRKQESLVKPIIMQQDRQTIQLPDSQSRQSTTHAD
jgi:uncharacterized membrane protein